MAAVPVAPLLWWAKDRLLTLSEQACDDWVLATGQRGEDYADTLLSLAAQRQMAFLPTVIGKEEDHAYENSQDHPERRQQPENPQSAGRWA